MNEFPELRAALVAAAERQRYPAGSGSARTPGSRRRSRWPLQLRAIAIAIVALLGIAAVALAAAGVFSPGRPAAPVSAPKPRTFNGAAILSTIRVPAVRADDPAGGPEWGLRLLDTTRGEVCIAPGRVQDGIIGVLGRDRAFGNDGRLHPFAADYIDPLGCALPDARGNAFLNIGQSGLPASALGPKIAAAGGCRLDNPPPADRGLLCATRDLRDVYYGLLGPDAVSVTYRTSSGALATEATAGPDGAYLIVLPYARGHLQGNATIGVGLSGGPILSVRYRDGHTCDTAHDHTCSPVGYRTPRGTNLTAAQVRAPISAKVVAARSYCASRRSSTVVPCPARVPPGFSRIGGAPFVLIDITFTARLPVANSHSRYQLHLSYTTSHSCTIGGLDGPTNADIHAGQRVRMQDFHPLSCPGPVHGAVRYVQGNALGPVGLPGAPAATSVLVGRFVVNPTHSNQRHDEHHSLRRLK